MASFRRFLYNFDTLILPLKPNPNRKNAIFQNILQIRKWIKFSTIENKFIHNKKSRLLLKLRLVRLEAICFFLSFSCYKMLKRLRCSKNYNLFAHFYLNLKSIFKKIGQKYKHLTFGESKKRFSNIPNFSNSWLHVTN